MQKETPGSCPSLSSICILIVPYDFPLILSFEREQTLRNNWQVISSHYLPAMLITSHYLPAACSFVQFVNHRESVLNWKDHFSQTKECQHLAALCKAE